MIKNMYVDSIAFIRVKWGEIGCFRIDSSVRQDYIMSPLFFYTYMVAVMEVKMGVRFLEEGREWRLTGLLYADDLVLKWAMLGYFAELCERRGLKVNVD